MEYIMLESHLELLQAILVELVRARDPEATFVSPTTVSEPEEKAS